MHMLWKCPKLFRYWSEIVETLNKVFSLELKMEPKLCILGVGEDMTTGTCKSTIVQRCLFQARKLIAQRWQARTPPQIDEWCKTVTKTMWKEKAVYIKKEEPKSI